VHHGLSSNANDWQNFCARLCVEYGIDFISESVHVDPRGEGIESAARKARYGVFARYLQAGDYLLTAHHADDQAETLLLRLLRGTGADGLSGIAVRRSLGQGDIYRPLLSFTRQELEQFAMQYQLSWVNDESNSDVAYDRNYLRQQVMPLLEQRWPEFSRRWQLTAANMTSRNYQFDSYVNVQIENLDSRAERIGFSIDIRRLLVLADDVKYEWLRVWFRKVCLQVPGHAAITAIVQQCRAERSDSLIEERWGNIVSRVFQQRLYAFTLADWQLLQQGTDVSSEYTWRDGLIVPACSLMQVRLEFVPQVESAGCIRADLATFHIEFRKGGERFHPHNRNHSQTLKKLFQENNVEPWWREKMPLIYVGHELIAVANKWVGKQYLALDGEPGFRVIWERRRDK